MEMKPRPRRKSDFKPMKKQPKNLEMSVLLDVYGDVLTEKQREVLEMYYNQDFSLAEIGENFSISRQGARDSIKHGEAAMVELEEKLNFLERYRIMQDGLQTISSFAIAIVDYNKKHIYSESLVNFAREILLVTDQLMEL